jgi:hypothetical protein
VEGTTHLGPLDQPTVERFRTHLPNAPNSVGAFPHSKLSTGTFSLCVYSCVFVEH